MQSSGHQRLFALCGVLSFCCAQAALGRGPAAVDLLESIPSSTPMQTMTGPYFGLSVPAYESRPEARARIFLDFDGDTTSSWGIYSPGTTPAYDIDGNAATFSQTEINNIHEIWQRVAEKFSIWDINVTTVDPTVYNIYETARVVIGGDGKNDGEHYWYGGDKPAGGIGWVSGFTNPEPNYTTAYVFPGNLGNGFAKFVAEASEHETGHLIGLNHQSVYSGTEKTFEYNPGTPDKAPIMGRSYDSTRGLWWKGSSSLAFNLKQFDLDSVAGDTNFFLFRPDDHADTYDQATPLALEDGALIGRGVIEYMSDKDFFVFTTGGGMMHIEVDPFSPGGMLDASLSLYDAAGSLLLTAATPSLIESLDADLAAGQYELKVFSAGAYGDVGQYTVGAYVPEPSSALLVAGAFLILARRKPLSEGAPRGR
jgi:hypothetical protein